MIKPQKTSPTFEKLNRELLRECAKTTESSKRVIEVSKKLAEETNNLLERLRATRYRAN